MGITTTKAIIVASVFTSGTSFSIKATFYVVDKTITNISISLSTALYINTQLCTQKTILQWQQFVYLLHLFAHSGELPRTHKHVKYYELWCNDGWLLSGIRGLPLFMEEGVAQIWGLECGKILLPSPISVTHDTITSTIIVTQSWNCDPSPLFHRWHQIIL